MAHISKFSSSPSNSLRDRSSEFVHPSNTGSSKSTVSNSATVKTASVGSSSGLTYEGKAIETINYDNERRYLNDLISGGGGNAEWAKQQLKKLNDVMETYILGSSSFVNDLPSKALENLDKLLAGDVEKEEVSYTENGEVSYDVDFGKVVKFGGVALIGLVVLNKLF